MKGLPRTGDAGFEIFDEGNFGISDFVQRTNHTRAIQGELARTISMMDAIRSAKVFVVKPENNLLLSEDPNDPDQVPQFMLIPVETHWIRQM